MTQNPDIKVQVQTRYLADQIPVEEGKYAFAYRVSITNLGQRNSQLLTRYWLITDGNGKTSEVHGDGVVGKQPVIEPGESFTYTSGAVIETPVGTMHGSYQMVAEDGQTFDATIPRFVLSAPRTLH